MRPPQHRRVRRTGASPRSGPGAARDARGRADRVAHPLGASRERQDDARASPRQRERAAEVSFSAVLQGVKSCPRGGEAEAELQRSGDRRSSSSTRSTASQGAAGCFLPHVEAGTIPSSGRRPQNPSFEVIAPLLSRARVLSWSRSRGGVGQRHHRALTDRRTRARATELTLVPPLATSSSPKPRETPASPSTRSDGCSPRPQPFARTPSISRSSRRPPSSALRYDKAGEEHYNIHLGIHQKSSARDPDAALYWMTRMLEAERTRSHRRAACHLRGRGRGERGPQALQVAVAAKMPSLRRAARRRIPLAQAVTFLATCPKSNPPTARSSPPREVPGPGRSRCRSSAERADPRS